MPQSTFEVGKAHSTISEGETLAQKHEKSAATASRLHSLDTIRAGAMLLAIPFHASLMYAAGQDWFIASPERSHLLTWLAGLLNGVRMPLFFCIAGMLSAVVLTRRKAGEWLKRRVVRLCLPLFCATLAISPVVMFAMTLHDPEGSTSAAGWFELISSPGGHWIGHLWFLQVLLGCSILAVIMQRLERGNGVLAKMLIQLREAQLTLRFVLILAVFISVWRLLINGVIKLGSDFYGYDGVLSGMLRVEALAEFGPYFLLGYLLRDRPIPEFHNSRPARGVLLLSGICYSLTWYEPQTVMRLIKYIVVGPLSIFGTVTILGWLSRIITKRNSLVDYFVRASYNIYLFHYPVVLLAGLLLFRLDWPVMAEFTLVLLITLTVSFAIDAVVRQSRTLTWLFNGTK